MKKFLTVLLALSVVFTYTVGTAFAGSQVSTVSASEYATSNTSKVAATTAAKYANTYSASAIEYAKTQAAKVVDEKLVSDLITVIEDKAGNIDNEAGMNAFKAEIDKWLGLDPTGAAADYIGNGSISITGGTKDLSYAEATYDALFIKLAEQKEFDGRVADAKTLLESYDTSIYSSRAYDADYTYRTYADKLIKDALAELVLVTKTSDIKNEASVPVNMPIGSASGQASDYKAVITGILYGYTFDQAAATATYVTLGTKASPVKDGTANSKIGVMGKLAELLKVSDEPSEDQNDKISLEQAKLTLEQYAKKTFFDTVNQTAGTAVNETYDTVKNNKLCGVYIADTKKLTKAEASAINTAIMDDINKALSVMNVYLEEKSTAPGTDVNTFTGDLKNYIVKAISAADKYEETANLAAKMKKELMFDGTKKYNDADVDAALAKDKTEIYANFQDLTKAKSYLSEVKVVTDEVGAAIDAAKAKFIDKVILSGANKTEDADKKYCKNYYDASFNYDYTLIKAETIDKLENAKTVEEVNIIMAEADTKLAELRPNDANTSAFTSGVTRYKAALEEYAKEQCKLLNKNDLTTVKDYRPASFLDNAKNGTTSALEAGFEIIENAKNADALPAAYEEAKALFKNIKTNADLNAEAKKVTDLLAALPTAAEKDLSNEAQFVEAVKAYNEYLDQYGAEKGDVSGYAIFEVKAAALKGYQEAALTEAISNLSKLAPIDIEDKDAVKAIRDKLEGYLDLYKIDSALYDGTNDGNINHGTFTLGAAAYKKLTDAEMKIWVAEVEEVENLIKKLNDASSLEELKAAKAAYDALTGSQQREVRETLGEAFLYKLEVIEKNQIKSVEALKLTASSTAGKGYIKVKWSVKGDATAADGYQVYRSTKRNSGFGTKPYFTTKNKTYKNTKSLKKGTRYYYKVRAYKVVDGKKVYSDWSNKAYRIAK